MRDNRRLFLAAGQYEVSASRHNRPSPGKQKFATKLPLDEGYGLYHLRLTELVFLQASKLMVSLMSGLYVYSIIAAGCLPAVSIWTWRRYDVPPSKQAEIAFFFVAFMLWMGTMVGFFSPFELPVRRLAQRQPSEPVLARATPESVVPGEAKNAVPGPLDRYDRWTAVYDISGHTVYLPNGTRLEAHSGLGDRQDDPSHVHERMRGATPPDVYELAPRERLFHGVQALRLKPVGGRNVFGRAGLLAHTYMLGPNGDSNGCVVFKDYEAFLEAFLNGEIKRLVVVAHLD